MADTQTEIYLTEKLQTELVNRLRRLEGHVRGITEMIGRKESCDDILIQLSAVKSALNRVIVRLLEGHMDSCVKQCVVEGDEEEIDRFKDSLAIILKHF